ncbi:hypothetical protein NDU88_002091 [Pleurodeles waltl]|uniref:Uncharacterized protein n=1 Tax=Pleurodeles waltl TaxID=8319 RepID=A0AAV7SAM5_PLEWA|nr:hypothetical protein NDU88_002091 [Pleurodeles waltl]
MCAASAEQLWDPQDLSVSAILAAHTQRFDNILRAVQSVKSTLEPKIDALCIDMGHLHEEHKKLKQRVTSMVEQEAWLWLEDRGMTPDPSHPPSRFASVVRGEITGSGLGARRRPLLLNRPPWKGTGLVRRWRASGFPWVFCRKCGSLGCDVTYLAMVQVRAILGEGPMVTPQSAEDLL